MVFGFEAADLDATFLVVMAWIVSTLVLAIWYLRRKRDEPS